MTRVLKYKDKVKTVRTGQDKKTGKETFTTINDTHHPISKRTKDKNREKARYKSGRVHDGRSRVPTQEYIDGWNAIYRKEEDEKEK
tara:strand:+ start:274 stop:531 length:258 start_codon:yes stop_codon:yes gene_type:complete